MTHLYFVTKIIDLLDTVSFISYLLCAPISLTRAHTSYYSLLTFLLLHQIFFTLRKKNNQISFLHLYHHAGMVALSWSGVKWFTSKWQELVRMVRGLGLVQVRLDFIDNVPCIPAGHATMLMMVNSAVHTVLYAYYLLTSISSAYSDTWWKKYITKIQLVSTSLYIHVVIVRKLHSIFLIQHYYFCLVFRSSLCSCASTSANWCSRIHATFRPLDSPSSFLRTSSFLSCSQTFITRHMWRKRKYSC